MCTLIFTHVCLFYLGYVDNFHHDDDNVVLVHSVELHEMLHSTSWYYAPYSFDRDALGSVIEAEMKKVKDKLEEYAQMMRQAKLKGTVKSIHANKPGEGIIQASKEVDADMIVMGSRGHGTIRRTLMGSVSDYVLHHSLVPVTICRHKDHPHGHHHHEQVTQQHSI
ncbi:hypothetical protein KUTeg_020754 [Tegillarca granosa]|uniref:UspA domain-containing protein n=1 Tax=Tegillarca granosa TaxID=220873 RepID=A0ABQ9EDZ5_TEGGR|nr:hypothetical protein KUTeg_020754 [Tegillarca granosa]